MTLKVNENAHAHLEKITNEPFDDIIGHSEGERKYFTVENNDIIYKKFREELEFYTSYPYLGPCIDFGLGTPCIEESNGTFKYYVIDRGTKFQFEEFTDVRDAIDHLVEAGYAKYELVNDPSKMKDIIYETLGLEKDRTIIKK